MAQMNLPTEQKQTHRHREQTRGCQGGGGRSGRDWEFGVSRCQLFYSEWISNEVLLRSTGNYIQSLVKNMMEDKMKKRKCVYIYFMQCTCRHSFSHIFSYHPLSCSILRDHFPLWFIPRDWI